MRKKILLILGIFLLCFSLISCSSSNNYEQAGSNEGIVNSDSSRKVIYKGSVTIHTDDMNHSIQVLIDHLPEKGWIDEEKIQDSSSTLVLRIPTESFNQYVYSLGDAGSTSNLSLQATDITSTYNDVLAQKESLEKEKARLYELMESSSAEEIVSVINPRICEIDNKLNVINQQLEAYDTTLDFSTLTISLVLNKNTGFWHTIGNAFEVSGKAFVGFFKYVFYIIIVVGPIVITIGAICFAIIFPIRLRQKRKQKKDKE